MRKAPVVSFPLCRSKIILNDTEMTAGQTKANKMWYFLLVSALTSMANETLNTQEFDNVN
jgi:hypothetical protein